MSAPTVRLLGPVRLEHGGVDVALGHKERIVLAVLALAAPASVDGDRLVDAVWPETAPRTARRTLQAYVSRLRSALPDSSGATLFGGAGGYRLELAAGVVDSLVAEGALRRAEVLLAAGNAVAAVEQLAAAERLWQGRSLGDLASVPSLAAAAERLDGLRLTIVEQRTRAAVTAGLHAEVLPELRALAVAHPLREHLWVSLVLSLQRSGRWREATDAAAEIRAALSEDAGLEPGPELRRVERLLAQGSSSRPAPGDPGPPGGDPAAALPPMLRPRRALTPLVGRDREMAALDSAWDRAVGGVAGIALLDGDPGVGKSRLTIEVARRASAAGAVVLAGSNDEGVAAPYQPLIAALRRVVEVTPPDRLAARLGPQAGELVRVLPELGTSLTDLRLPVTTEPETARFRLVAAFASWVRTMAADAPVLLVVDDLHWAESATLLALRHLVADLDDDRVLVVATYRSGEVWRHDSLGNFLAQLRRAGRAGAEALRLHLGGLERDATLALLAALTGATLTDEAGALAARIHDDSEGNPFFVEELLAHLRETGIVPDVPGATWEPARPTDSLGLPVSVREVLRRRLDGLPAPTRQVLRTAAVMGREVPANVLDAAVRAAGAPGRWPAAPPELAELADALQPALDAGVLTERGEARRQVIYEFTHALIPATLRDGLGLRAAAVLHAAAATAYAEVYVGREDLVLPELARHHLEAVPVNGPAAAVAACRRAADDALRRLAFDEAADLAAEALQLLDAEVGHGRVELLLTLAEARFRSGSGDHRRPLEEAWSLAAASGDAALWARSALACSRGYTGSIGSTDAARVAALEHAVAAAGGEESPTVARLLAELAAELIMGPGQRQRYLALSDRAVAMARRVDDAEALAAVLVLRLGTVWEPQAIAERTAIAAEGLALAAASDDPVQLVRFATHAVFCAVETGRPEQLPRLEAILRQTTPTLGQAVWEYTVSYPLMNLESMRGTPASMRAAAAGYEELGVRLGLPEAPIIAFAEVVNAHRWEDTYEAVVDRLVEVSAVLDGLPVLRTWCAEVFARVGRTDEAVAILDEYLATGFDLPLDHSLAASLAELALGATEVGHSAAAEALLERLEPLRGLVVRNPCNTVGPAERLLGRCYDLLGDHRRADADFAVAIEVAARMGSGVWEAHVRLDWAERLVRRGERAAAEHAARAAALAGDLGLHGVTARLRRLGQALTP